MTVKLLTEHHLEFLSLKGGCTGSSESTLVKMPHCWKSHVTAQLCFVEKYWKQFSILLFEPLMNRNKNSCLEDFDLSRFDFIQTCHRLSNKVSFLEVLLVYVIGIKMTADVNACPTLSPWFTWTVKAAKLDLCVSSLSSVRNMFWSSCLNSFNSRRDI